MRIVTSQEARTPVASPKNSCTLWDRLAYLENKWDEIQVGRQGSYSIERLESLNNYCKTTSKSRSVLICILTPLPALAVALLLESIPLRPPSEGWAANWAFWVRLFLMQLAISFAASSQMAAFVPGLNFTLFKRLVTALGVGCAFTGICILASSTIGFPVPLVMQFGTIPVGIITPAMLRIVLGPDLFARNLPFKRDSDRFLRVLVAQIALVGVYPLYKVLYDFVPGLYKSAVVVIVLPLWKFGAKRLMIRATRNLEDYMPQLVAFTVDFFGTLFVSRCISSVGSRYFSGLLFAADVAASLLEFREARNNALVLLQMVQDRHTSSKHLPRIDPQQTVGSSELLEILLSVTRNPLGHHVKSFSEARLWACLPHPITKEQRSQLHVLGKLGVYVQEGMRATEKIKCLDQNSRKSRLGFQSSVVPVPTTDMVVKFATDNVSSNDEPGVELSSTPLHNKDAESIKRAKIWVLQGLQLLFHTEYLILVEYVDCFVPLVFLVYELVLKVLPNAIYYPRDVDNWGVSAISNLLLLAALEVGLFWFVYQLLRQKLGISSVHQLAFVLKTQAIIVQAQLLVLTVLLLQYELLHLGADFSLEFKWLHDSSH